MNQALGEKASLNGGMMDTAAIGDSEPGHRSSLMTIYDTLIARYRARAGLPAEQWRALMSAIGPLIVTYDNLPELLRARLELVNTAWGEGNVDQAFLQTVKIECWEFLDAKHGNSTGIVDREDRAVRAMLSLLEPNGDALAASDTANWVDEMLGSV